MCLAFHCFTFRTAYSLTTKRMPLWKNKDRAAYSSCLADRSGGSRCPCVAGQLPFTRDCRCKRFKGYKAGSETPTPNAEAAVETLNIQSMPLVEMEQENQSVLVYRTSKGADRCAHASTVRMSTSQRPRRNRCHVYGNLERQTICAVNHQSTPSCIMGDRAHKLHDCPAFKGLRVKE